MPRKYHIGQSRVMESRETLDGAMIRRRRETLDGKFRFTTYERIESPTIIVKKRSGGKELFDRDKLLSATRKSVGKFFTSELEVEDVVNRVESSGYYSCQEEIPSKFIGEAMLDVLAEVNEVAFVRFASVFREFKSLDEFEAIIKERRKKREKKRGKK
jgi:transcriptional repressor NrdR